ncbi:MAG: VWA domain-containing protein, partial [Opitutus sp.]
MLLWLVFVPLGLVVLELTRRRGAIATDHEKILRAEAGAHSRRLTTLNSARSISSSRTRPWLHIGIAIAVIAAARPQWGRMEEPVFDQAREILMAIDLSRSMLTPDVKPSRLDRAKLLTQSLLEKLEGERVGLVVFSGTAFLQSPLSADYEILREFLPALNPEFLPEGGTNYRALIDTSLAAFGSTAAADRFLVVLSDGEATTDDWRERVDDLKKKGIRVIGLGVGTIAGAMIPDGAGGLVKDERGAVVLSKLESSTLRELADKTNGVYQDASNWIDVAALVSSTVESGKKGQFTDKNT